MAGVDATDLQALCEEFLAACVQALDTVPTFVPELGGAPARSFVAPGQPAADCCPQLTVHVTQILEDFSGVPAGRSATFGRINSVGMAMTLFRCVDMESKLPSVADLEAASTQLNADGWALWNHLYNMVRADQLFSKCANVTWGNLSTLIPEGGCAGWYWPITVQIDGYEETLSS